MELVNVYCDESRHLSCDEQRFMVLGAVYLPTSHVRKVSDKIRAVKARHNIAPDFEIKWTKVSPGKIEFYQELIDVYLDSDELSFRCVVASKAGLDHERFNQTHDDWYYKIYYQLLRRVIVKPRCYRVFIDIKDTRGHKKIENLRKILQRAKDDDDLIKVMQQIRSNESQLLQLSDFLTGAVSHVNSQDGKSKAKALLINKLQGETSATLSETTPLSSRKLNVFCWTPL